LWDIPEPFVASLFAEGEIEEAARQEGIHGDFTRFEQACLLTASRALKQSGVDATSNRVLFVLSTTKGDIGTPLGETATRISRWFGNPNTPVVVCNACISGLHGLIEAKRMVESGSYDYAVVIGADIQSPFIVSGFLSFKALSCDPCRPFDEDRTGLNLGDAAACMILGRADENTPAGAWCAVRGAVRNDACHISSPSKTAEGCYRALKMVTEGLTAADICHINLHGTATLYNDEMEAVGVHRAGFSALPVNSLKGYLGHTMGAAGIIESLVTMCSLDEGLVLGTRGYENIGVSRPLNLSAQHQAVRGHRFVKAVSGFGGGNAAMLYERRGGDR